MPQKQNIHVLVTGGAGFIGSHSVDALLEEGFDVRVLDNLTSGAIENLPQHEPRLEFVEGDITDGPTVYQAMQDISHCLHLAAQVSVTRSIEDPKYSGTQNIIGCVNVFQQARLRRLRKVVYASSAAVYGNPSTLPVEERTPLAPLSPYELEKQVNEQYAALFSAQFGLSLLGLRYFNVYGPRQDPKSPYAGVISKFTDCLTRSEAPTVFGDGTQTRDFVYVKDVARANLAALLSNHDGVCNVATGTEVNLLELLRILSIALDVHVDPKQAGARIGDILESRADVTRQLDWLDFVPQWALADGLRAYIVEALECGLPAVSTACVGGPREILADGKFGRLVPVNDPVALAKAMENALSVPADREALKARAQFFSIDRSVDQYLKVLLPDDLNGPSA